MMLNEFENDNKGELVPNQPEHVPTAEEQEKMDKIVQQFREENLKKIKVSPVSEALKNEFNEAVESLEFLKKEVLGKKEDAQNLSIAIKARVDSLLKYEEVNINQREYLEAEKSVTKYLDLLQSIVDEVSGEISRYAMLFPTDGQLDEITVWKNDPSDFSEYVEYAVKNIRKYAKSVRKNLVVSYSRYSFGFESQLKKISYLESVLKHEAAHKAGSK